VTKEVLSSKLGQLEAAVCPGARAEHWEMDSVLLGKGERLDLPVPEHRAAKMEGGMSQQAIAC
jgi:hypothetical protein